MQVDCWQAQDGDVCFEGNINIKIICQSCLSCCNSQDWKFWLVRCRRWDSLPSNGKLCSTCNRLCVTASMFFLGRGRVKRDENKSWQTCQIFRTFCSEKIIARCPYSLVFSKGFRLKAAMDRLSSLNFLFAASVSERRDASSQSLAFRQILLRHPRRKRSAAVQK